MSCLRVVYVSFLLVVLNFGNAEAGPMEPALARYLKGSANEQNDWRLILSSIESRLNSLDHLYTSQLTPTLEARLEHFQQRISGMEVKLLRVEALLTSKLDRMSDNISSRHFRDDMVQTDMFRKIETAYDGITHRLAYMDRKSENAFLKLQEKSETFSKKMESMNNALTDKYDSIESQLTDIVDGMEDINKSFHSSGTKPTKYPDKKENITQQMQSETQDKLRSNPLQEFIKEVKIMCGNSSENLKLLREEFNDFRQGNSTEKSFNSFSDHLERLLNEYASKVSDLGAQGTKSDFKIASHLSTIEKVVNSSKAEMQNGMRALMVQVGKLSRKDDTQYEVIDQKLLSDVAQKLDTNFEKVISTQNTFMESCHRLQMDESQLEGQISDILNKLIDNFEATTREHHHVLRKIEGLLVKHDIHTKKELHQANANIKTAYEQYKKESEEIQEKYKQTADNLEALFALVQNVIGNDNGVIRKRITKEKELIDYIQSLERALNSTKLQQMEILDSYKLTIETLIVPLNQTKQEDTHFTNDIMKNLTQSLSLLKERIENNKNTTLDILNTVDKTYNMVKKNSENLIRITDAKYHQDINNRSKSREAITKQDRNNRKIPSTTNSTNNTDIDSLIREIFFINRTDTTTSSTTQNPSLDVDIDVRFNLEEDSNNTKPTTKFQNANASNENTNETDTTNCLEIPIDPRFNHVQSGNDTKNLCGDKNQETKSIEKLEEHLNITENFTTEKI